MKAAAQKILNTLGIPGRVKNPETNSNMRWDYVYEEEFPDAYGYCSVGIISNGKKFLFFTVCCDEAGGAEVCRIFSSLTFDEETLECEYLWNAENDEILFACLNSLAEQDICGEGSPIRSLQFHK